MPPSGPSVPERRNPARTNQYEASDPDLRKLAHDLAMVYLNNRYGVEVHGSFGVSSSSNERDCVSSVFGEGSVETDRFPGVDVRVTTRELTDERHLFGFGPRKSVEIATDEFAVDDEFREMISDYFDAYRRFSRLLNET